MKGDREQKYIRLGEFSVNLATSEVYRGSERLVLQSKPFRVLELLLKSVDGYASREHIQQVVWPNVHVDSRRCLNTTIRKLRKTLGDAAADPRLIETVGARGYRIMIQPVFPVDTALEPDVSGNRLAVLPFQNLNAKVYDYFSSGLTDQLIAELGRVQWGLSVIAPLGILNSREPPSVSSELCGDYVLSGSTLRSRECFRITAKLVRCRDHVCVWSESFTRDSTDIFLVQDEIARQIATAIERALPMPSHRHASLTTTPAAYDRYLKAKYFVAKGTEPAFSKAAKLFEQVIGEDSEFAPAYGSLAILYTAAGQYGGLPPRASMDASMHWRQRRCSYIRNFLKPTRPLVLRVCFAAQTSPPQKQNSYVLKR